MTKLAKIKASTFKRGKYISLHKSDTKVLLNIAVTYPKNNCINYKLKTVYTCRDCFLISVNMGDR